MKPDVAKLRQTILQLAVEGKLVPQLPSDEPASVLLRQIETEKQKLIAEGKIRKGSSLPEITEEEEPFVLPEKWEWVRLNQVLDVRDGTHDTPRYVENGVPLVTSKNLFPHGLDMSSAKHISEKDHEEISRRSGVNTGDVLYAMIGTIGNPVIVGEDHHFSIKNMALFKHYSDGFVMSKYLHSYLNYATTHMKNNSSGSVQSFVSLGFLRNYIMPLPPIEEQKRIVAKVDELMALCGELDAKSDNFLETLAKLRQTILRLAVEGKLVPQDPSEEPASQLLKQVETEKKKLNIKDKSHTKAVTDNDEKPYDIPPSWEWTTLGAYTQIIGGGTPRSGEADNFSENGIAWLTPADLSGWNELYIYKGRRDISEKGLKTSSARLLPKGTVLFTSRAPIGYVALAANEVTTNQGFKSFVPYVKESNKYLYYFLKSAARRIDASAPGTTFKEVSGARLAIELLPLPPIDEQKRIVSKIDELMALCDELETKLT